MSNILHITPHLGGGVGTVLLGYIEKASSSFINMQSLACLDFANEKAREIAEKYKIKLHDNLYYKQEILLRLIEKADIVLIHWWNHPLLFDFLVRADLPPCRLVLWSHISGLHLPSVFTDKILNYPDIFVFTTPLSNATSDVEELSVKRKSALRTIWSAGDLEKVQNIKPVSHNGFRVGYIGTVDYIKLHPDFLDICSKVNIPDVKFIVCGGDQEKEIQRETISRNVNEKFEFTGKVSDINEYLSSFDVFGYPLSPYHYGTCDQSLAEAMAAGVVPVVFANPMEKSMVRNMETGLIVQTAQEYVDAIDLLYKNPDLKNRLSKNAREFALMNFSQHKMISEWDKLFKEIISIPKQNRKWAGSDKLKKAPYFKIFIESLGKSGQLFDDYCNETNSGSKKKLRQLIKDTTNTPNWHSQTKGTAFHYYSFFKEDKCLEEITGIITTN